MRNRFFNVSDRNFDNGQIVDLNGAEANFVADLNAINANELEQMFESLRPLNAPQRMRALFVFNNIDSACWFLEGEQNFGAVPRRAERFIYEVDCDPLWRCPLCLVNIVNRRRASNWEPIVNEYWNPTNQWNIQEILTNRMRIINRVTCDRANIMLTQTRFMNDVDQANRLWPLNA